MKKNRLVSILTGAALVLGSAVVVAPAASAASSAPSCVKVQKLGRDWAGFPGVKVTNNCSTTKRVKVVWAYAPDSECIILAKGKSKTHRTGVAGKFDGVFSC